MGTYGRGNSPVEDGFVLRGGVLTTLDAPGSAGVTHAYGINNAGDAVGDYVDAAGRTHGFLLHDGRYTTLDGPGMSTQTVLSDRRRR